MCVQPVMRVSACLSCPRPSSLCSDLARPCARPVTQLCTFALLRQVSTESQLHSADCAVALWARSSLISGREERAAHREVDREDSDAKGQQRPDGLLRVHTAAGVAVAVHDAGGGAAGGCPRAVSKLPRAPDQLLVAAVEDDKVLSRRGLPVDTELARLTCTGG